MNQGQTVMTGVVMVIIVSLFTAAILWLMPLYKHYSFVEICRQYGLMVELDNGLTDENRIGLQSQLNQIGIESVVINVPSPYEIRFKTSMIYKVKGIYKQGVLKSLFQSETKEMTFSYETEIRSRKISN